MDERTRRFQRHDDQQEDELRLDEVLEHYEQDEPEAYDAAAPDFAPYGDAQPPYEEQPYDENPSAYEPPYEEENQPSYGDPYDEEYSDYHEAIDEAVSQAGRFRVAMGVFDTVSILVGIGVILLLVAMLVSLVSWLRSDILHSALLLQSGLQ